MSHAADAAMPIRWFNAGAVTEGLEYPKLFRALEAAYRTPPLDFPRQSLAYEDGHDKSASVMLLMSALNPSGLAGVKIVTINPARPGGALRYVYMALDVHSGEPVALIEAETLSCRRTAATAVMASQNLARKDATEIVILGTGNVVSELIPAYAAGFPKARLHLWGRRFEATEAMASAAAARGITIHPVRDRAAAIAQADIISAATAAPASGEALIQGAWLKPGAHVDIMGAYSRELRETDSAVMRRAACILVDNVAAPREAGDLVLPIEAGELVAQKVASLTDLLNGRVPGRGGASDITVFKSVGHALADLAAAELLLGRR